MPRFIYKCPACQTDYVETRLAEHPQFYTNCNCGAEFDLVAEEPAI